jgi:hypothetical protein
VFYPSSRRDDRNRLLLFNFGGRKNMSEDL